MGHPIATVPSKAQWAFIATVNISTEDVMRCVTVEGLMMAWKEGRFHESFFTVTRTPIPHYDTQPWQVTASACAWTDSRRCQ